MYCHFLTCAMGISQLIDLHQSTADIETGDGVGKWKI